MKTANHNYVALEHVNIISKNYLTIQMLLGNTCNFSCSYCPVNLHNGTIPWANIICIKKFIIKIKQQYSDKNICIEFTGGEVTLYKDFIEICKFCKENDIFVKFLTNGSRSIRWWKENKKHFDSVVMSYHSEFVNLDHFCNVIIELKDCCMVQTNVVMSLELWDTCIEAANRIKDIGNCPINLKPLKYEIAGDLYPYNAEQLLVFRNQKKLFGDHVKWTKTIPTNLRSKMVCIDDNGTIVSKSSYSDFFVNKTNSWLGWECWAGLEQLIVDIDGEIYRGWCKVGGSIGNIDDENLKLPTTTIMCNKDFCGCASDVICTKRKSTNIGNS